MKELKSNLYWLPVNQGAVAAAPSIRAPKRVGGEVEGGGWEWGVGWGWRGAGGAVGIGNGRFSVLSLLPMKRNALYNFFMDFSRSDWIL